MRRVTSAAFLVAAISSACQSPTTQPQKILIVEPSAGEKWIKSHGAEYRYIWQSRNDGPTVAYWKQYAPNTVLSSYFPYMRDPTAIPLSNWLINHPDWILYKCDGETIAYQFGNAIVPLDIGNPRVRAWQLSNFSASWQSDVGIDNFQLGGREHACGTRSKNGDFTPRYSGHTGIDEFDSRKLDWLEQVSKKLHAAKKTLTINYSLDVPARSEAARRIVSSVDGLMYEDYWGGAYRKGIYTTNSRMLELMRFFAFAESEKKSLYFIFQLKNVDRPSVETAMATYLINATDRSGVYISAIQRYGIVPQYLGYDKSVGEPCEPPKVRQSVIERRFEGADVVLRLPDAEAAVFPAGNGRYVDVDGYPLTGDIPLSDSQGLIAYRLGKKGCANPDIELPP